MTHTAGFSVSGLVSRKAASASSDQARVRSDAPPARTSTASLIASAATRLEASEFASLLSRSALPNERLVVGERELQQEFLGLAHRIAGVLARDRRI